MGRMRDRSFRDQLHEALGAFDQTLDQKLDHAISQYEQHDGHCFVFDFDDTLVELTKAELEHPECDDFELNRYTDPVDEAWEILERHAAPNGHVIILTGRDKMSTIDWLRNWGRSHLIDNIFSCNEFLNDLAKAKKEILTMLAANYDSVFFVDNNDSNLMAATQVPGVTVCKVSDLEDRIN